MKEELSIKYINKWKLYGYQLFNFLFLLDMPLDKLKISKSKLQNGDNCPHKILKNWSTNGDYKFLKILYNSKNGNN